MLLEGRTALVTGVGPGMGRDIALAMAREGADVVLVARSDKVVPTVAEEIRRMGRRAFEVYGNIAKADSCQDIAQQAAAISAGLVAEFGEDRAGLDILVNSAFHAGEHVRFEDADLTRWRRPMDINYFGTLQVTQALLPQLRVAAARAGDARIVMVNTMDVHSIRESAGSYAASKAALGAVTKTLAVELGAEGIRVNAVHPGYIWGESVRIYFGWLAEERGGDTTWEDIYREKADETALRYLPDSEEIAGAVVFYASPLARSVTGTALPVNAGTWMPPSA